MGTYNGLSIPLCGAYTTFAHDGSTTVSVVDDHGRFKHVAVITSSDTMKAGVSGASWASFYADASFCLRADTTATGNWFFTGVLAGLRYDPTATSGGWVTPLTSYLNMNTSGNNYGGRTALLTLLYEGGADSTPPLAAAHSWIDCELVDTTYPVKSFLTLEIEAADATNSCFETITASTATHGLVMYHNNTKYWIMVCNSSKE